MFSGMDVPKKGCLRARVGVASNDSLSLFEQHVSTIPNPHQAPWSMRRGTILFDDVDPVLCEIGFFNAATVKRCSKKVVVKLL